MTERLKLNSDLIRTHLEREHRKKSYLEEKLGVSESLVNQMLGGHVPKKRTLKRLAALLGVKESDLLIPKEDAA
jgi:transcriptional regulator with XRE-family HTH domain